MKKTVIIIAIIVIITIAAIVWWVKSQKPSLLSFDNLTKTGTYKYKGKKYTIDLRTSGTRVGNYTVTPLLQEVNVEGSAIGSIIGIALRKDGVIIDKITTI